jgi:hypothetical protein
MAQSDYSDTLADRIIGSLYALLYHTEQKRLLGFAVAGWLKNLPWLFASFAWPFGLDLVWIVAGIALAIILRFLYWRGKRAGYIRFVSEEDRQLSPGTDSSVVNQKVPVRASGTFSVKSWEKYVRQYPAEYWRVGMGDHALMVNYSSGLFLYQFIQPSGLETVIPGKLCTGRKSEPTLEITYLSNWGPESTEISFNFFARENSSTPAKSRRKIYLAFDSLEQRGRVWKSLTNGLDHFIMKDG